MTAGLAVSTEDCDIHGMDAEDQTQARLETVQQATAGGSHDPNDLAWNIGPNLTAEQREEMLALLREFRDVFAADISELGDSDIALHRINTQRLPPRMYHHKERQNTPAKSSMRSLTKCSDMELFSQATDMELSSQAKVFTLAQLSS